ncbi:hypothetical protein JTB14_024902 [Gonioctena quinquepunctata]|nr:hypothetical protein JTB14_024902 [Gonioctena quinquepunctata]
MVTFCVEQCMSSDQEAMRGAAHRVGGSRVIGEKTFNTGIFGTCTGYLQIAAGGGRDGSWTATPPEAYECSKVYRYRGLIWSPGKHFGDHPDLIQFSPIRAILFLVFFVETISFK